MMAAILSAVRVLAFALSFLTKAGCHDLVPLPLVRYCGIAYIFLETWGMNLDKGQG
jgi:hypothetical protein